MKIISFIEEIEIIERILRHLGLWDIVIMIHHSQIQFISLNHSNVRKNNQTPLAVQKKMPIFSERMKFKNFSFQDLHEQI